MTETTRPRGQRPVAKIVATVVIGVLLLFLFVPALQTFGRRLLTSSERIVIDDEAAQGDVAQTERALELVTLLPPDRIQALLNPQFVSSAEAQAWMDDDEQVLGLSIDGEHRAYPINMLSRHEIVNDVVGGEAVAVTW